MKRFTVLTSTLLLISLAACDSDTNGRIYTSMDPDDCSRLRFVCIEGQRAFSDETGCGCEMVDEDALMRQRSNEIDDKNTPFMRPPDANPQNQQQFDQQDRDDQIRSDDDPLDRDLDEIQNQRLENSD